MGSQLQIAVSQEQGRIPVTVFHLSGEIDADTYQELEKQARAAYQAGSRALVLDLAKVTYMSSAGLRALHTIFTIFRAATPDQTDAEVRQGVVAGTYMSEQLKLLNPKPAVLEVIKTAGFDMFLEIHHKLKDAIASF